MRQPRIVVSSVTTIASQPHASARLTRLSTSRLACSSRAGTSAGCRPELAATSSIGVDAWLEKIIGMPVAAAAARDGESASRWASSSTPIGASSTNGGHPAAEELDARVALGDVAQHRADDAPGGRKPSRLACIVRPAPAPPAM